MGGINRYLLTSTTSGSWRRAPPRGTVTPSRSCWSLHQGSFIHCNLFIIIYSIIIVRSHHVVRCIVARRRCEWKKAPSVAFFAADAVRIASTAAPNSSLSLLPHSFPFRHCNTTKKCRVSVGSRNASDASRVILLRYQRDDRHCTMAAPS